MTVQLDHLIGLYHLRQVDGGTRFRQSGLRFIFFARAVGGELTLPRTGEIAEFGWFEAGQLPDTMTHTGPFGIADAVAGRSGMLRELSG